MRITSSGGGGGKLLAFDAALLALAFLGGGGSLGGATVDSPARELVAELAETSGGDLDRNIPRAGVFLVPATFFVLPPLALAFLAILAGGSLGGADKSAVREVEVEAVASSLSAAVASVSASALPLAPFFSNLRRSLWRTRAIS